MRVSLQREVARVIEGKREVLAVVDTQNYDFNARYQAKVNEKIPYASTSVR